VRAWWVAKPGPVDELPLERGERPDPEPAVGQVRVRISACGVCRTDLHLVEGDLSPRRPAVIPGHEIVGRVDAIGAGARRFAVGDRIGIAWLRHTCGRCRWCRHGRENLCATPEFTGWDRDGGYAQYAVVDEEYGYRLPDGFDDEHVAPLLCAGIIGYRALRASALPPGGRLGIYGFGGSAHLAAQIAVHEGAVVHVVTRSEAAQQLARDLGAASAGPAAPPERLDAAVLFAPVGDLVPPALAALDRGATLAVAGIHLSDIPALNYQQHLFQERSIRSVTANTRRDGEELLTLAQRYQLEVATERYSLEAAPEALRDLAHGRVRGAAVLLVD
jgi:propanol-preferring alcohol dehydrogenase